MIDKKVCYKIEKYQYNQTGIIKDKITIDGSDYYLINNRDKFSLDKVRCDQVLYIETSRY
jgi:transposase